jgi:hypothetical protein
MPTRVPHLHVVFLHAFKISQMYGVYQPVTCHHVKSCFHLVIPAFHSYSNAIRYLINISFCLLAAPCT